MRTDVNMLGRSVSAFGNACPLKSSIRRASLFVVRDMKRHKTTASVIKDKQVVVVGGNRGIGLEVRILQGCQYAELNYYTLRKQDGKAKWHFIILTLV